MKKSLLSLLAAAALAVTSAFAANPEAQIAKGSPQSPTDPIWNTTPKNKIKTPSVGSSKDFQASWQGFWDDGNLYILITVADDDIQTNTTKDNQWNGDAAEVYVGLAPENAEAKIGYVQLALTPDGTKYKNADYFDASANTDGEFIRYLFKIPAENLANFDKKRIYLDFSVDYSENGNIKRESQYSWGQNPHDAAKFGTAENSFGIVTFVQNVSEIENSEENADNTLKIRALGNRTEIYDLGDFACLVAEVDAEIYNDANTTYEWRRNGEKYNGANANANNIRPTAPGTYTCVVKCGDKTLTSNAVEITTKTQNDNYLRKDGGVRTNLPILVIRTGDKQLPNWNSPNHGGAGTTPAKTKIQADMKIIWNGEGKLNSLADMANNQSVYYDLKARINYRGSTSRTMVKRSLALSTGKENLDADGNMEKGKFGLFGLPKEKDWVLYSAYQDKSHMRNKLAMDLARDMGYYASAARFVEVYIDGEYFGVYVLLEKYEQSENRINVTKEPKKNTDPAQTGYVLRFDKVDLNEPGTWYRGDVREIRDLPCLDGNCLNSYTGCGSRGGCGDAAASNTKQGWEIVYPDPSDFPDPYNDERINYIKKFLTNMELALYHANTDEQWANVFEKYIDMQSFADFMLLEEFARNTDGYRASMFFSKDVDGKLKCVAPWDFEMGFGNSRTHGGSLTDIWQHMYTASEYCNGLSNGDSEPYYPIPFWWEKLKRSQCFKNMLKTRWEYYREKILTQDAIWQRIDNMVAELTANGALDRDKQRWSWEDRNNCVTGCQTPPYNNCPWIILPWGDNMTNSDGRKIHPMPENMPNDFVWGNYTEDNGGKKTLTFSNEYMLLKGWIADRLKGMDKLINELGAETLDAEKFNDCSKAPAYEFSIVPENDVTEICNDGTENVKLSVKSNVAGTADISYQWKKNGEIIANETKKSLTASEAGTYSCDIRIDRLGGIPTMYQNYSPSIEINGISCIPEKNAIEFSVVPENGKTEICNDKTEAVTLSVKTDFAENMTVSYQWKKDGNDIQNEISESFTTSEAGKYSCEVKVSKFGVHPADYTYLPEIEISGKSCEIFTPPTAIDDVADDEQIVCITAYNALGVAVAKFPSFDKMPANLPTGVCLLRVETTKRSFVEKIIVR